MKKLSIFVLLLFAATLFAQNDVSGSTYYYVNQGIDEFNNFKSTFQENTGDFCDYVDFYQSPEVTISNNATACQLAIGTGNPYVVGAVCGRAAASTGFEMLGNNPEIGDSFGYQAIEYVTDPIGKSLEILCDPEPVQQIQYNTNEYEYKIYYGK